MSADGRWFVTPYALERYQRCIDPVADARALRALIEASRTARLVRELEPGVELWRVDRPMPIRCIVATDGPGLPQLLTVLTDQPSIIVRRRAKPNAVADDDIDYFTELDRFR